MVGGYLPEVVVLLDEITCSDWSYPYYHTCSESWDSWFDEPGMRAYSMAERGEQPAVQHR